MDIVTLIFFGLLWVLSITQVVAAPFTGWVWAKGGYGGPMIIGFKAYRGEQPFTYWLTFTAYLLLVFLIPVVVF